MRFLPWSGVFAAGGIWLLTGCQTGEPVNTQSASNTNPVQGQSANPSPEHGGEPATAPSRPDAATLEKFLAQAPSVTPDLPPPPADAQGPAMSLAKTAGTYSCNIDYNQAYIINTLPNKAWDTFAWAPFYNVSCGSAFWIYTYPLNQNHHHLMYEDPGICYSLSPPVKVGRYAYPLARIPGHCDQWNTPSCNYNSTDPANLPRFLSPHMAADIDQIYVLDHSYARRTFNLTSLYIEPNSYAKDGCYPDAGKIQLWYKVAATQQWWYWTWINPGQTFYPGSNGLGIDEIRITSPNAYTWGVDNIKLDVLY